MEKQKSRPAHAWLRPSSLLLVFVGGCVGAAARETLTAILPGDAAIPVAVLVANVLGAFLLGALLEGLGHRSDGSAARLRLLLGTGMLGGFTTYSSLALAVAALAHEGSPWLASAYGLGTLLLGGLATFVGIAWASATRHRRPGGRGA